MSILLGLPAPSLRHRDARLALLGIAALAAAAALPLRDVLFGGRALFWRDVHSGWLPLTEVVARGVRDGELPLWDRFAGFGRPLFADARAALLYAPTWLGLLLPRGAAYGWFVYLHLLLAGAGALVLGRRLGAGFGAALAGALGFVASGPLLSLAIMWHQLAGAAWMPWALWAGDVAVLTGGRLAIAGAGVAIALQVHAGSAEYALLTALMLPVLALFRGEPSGLPRCFLRLTAVAALALALAAPQALPTLLRARDSARIQDREAASVWSLHPLRLIETLLPSKLDALPLADPVRFEIFEGREPLLHSVLLGSGLVSLAVIGAVTGGRTAASLTLMLVGIVGVALGKYTPLYELAAALLPPLALVRYPQKAMVPAALLAALLAGLGLTQLARGRSGQRPVTLAASLAVAALVFGAAAWSGWSAGWMAAANAAGQRTLAWTGGLAVALAALPQAALLLRRSGADASGARVLALGFAAVACLPALAAHEGLLWTVPKDFFDQRPALLAHLDVSDHARLYGYDYQNGDQWQRVTNPQTGAMQVSDAEKLGLPAAWVRAAHDSLHPPLASRWGVPGSFDYDVLDLDAPDQRELCRLLRAREATPEHRRLLQLGAVRYAVAVTPGVWWRDLVPTAQVPTSFVMPTTLLRVPDPLPRAYAVSGARVVSGAHAARAALLVPDFDPRREVVLIGPAAAGAAEALDNPGEVRVREMRANRVRLDATLTRDGYVVLVDSWAPGWSATLDGAPVEILRANGIFRAVKAAAGRHTVELRYWPPGLTAGLTAAGLAAAAMLAAILAGPR